MNNFKPWMLMAGPLAAIAIYQLVVSAGIESAAALTAGVTVWCVLWWVFEPIPIPATSLVPFAVFQVSGVLDKSEIAEAYGSPLILLMLGGFILSRAMERSGAHRRIALYMINVFGGNSSRRLVLGFMVASALLSMWISNTATTLMLLPVALAILESGEDKQMAAPLMLGVAYAASIGGIGTPVGTPPNVVFMQVYEEATGLQVSFVQWMGWGVPVVIAMVPVAGLWVTRRLNYAGGFHLPTVGLWRAEEKRVLMVFAFTALAWVTRQEPWGGWSSWLNLPAANDASVALVAAILLFILPDGKNGRLMDWNTAVTIPWGVLLLFGGGICLAKAFVSSGLSTIIGDWMLVLAHWPVFWMMLVLCLCVTFMTETTSNMASTVLLMPVLAAAALAVGIDPRLLMVPAAISASCAFMLPVATAPNSIVFGSGYITTRQMATEGLFLNLVGAAVIASMCFILL